MSCKPELYNCLLDTVEFVAIVFLATVAIVCMTAFFATVVVGGCAG